MARWLEKLGLWLAGRKTVRARYDAAQTTHENRKHWAAADNLPADASATPEVRRVLRSRARYEVANNGYARGIVLTLANYVIGTGPRLQMLTDDGEVNRLVEREFARWAKAVRLAHKLRTMRFSQCVSGECFALLVTNPRISAPVQLDVRLLEADQVGQPFQAKDDRKIIDGIEYDEYGNPVSYTVLRHQPGSPVFATEYDVYPAEAVVHLYWADRPGQSRGVPEITSSLSLFAMLRRYTLASLSAAEHAAIPGGVIYTDGPADSEAQDVAPMDSVEISRGTWLTMPFGWKVGQIKAEQPTTIYSDFKHEIIEEIARPLNIPSNVARANSSAHSYASSRMDYQSFYRAVRIDQSFIEDVVLDRILAAWLSEAVLIEDYLPQVVREADAVLPHQWFWDGLEHVDPLKESNAQAVRLANHTTTLAAEYARAGLDWETEIRQRGREVALMRELGLGVELEVVEEKAEDGTDEE